MNDFFGGIIMRLFGMLGITCFTLGLSLNADNDEISEKPKELQTTRFILNQNQRAKEPYRIRYEGRDFVVYPDVFSPKYFPDTYWFEENVRIKPGDTFLEIGSGTGLISVMAAVNGAEKVTTVDISPIAVKNTTENAFLNHVAHKFRIYEGDVFDPIPDGQEFDVIFWFAPFMHVNIERDKLSYLEKSVFDPRYQSLRKYLSGARQYLRPNGRLLLGFSSSHGEIGVLKKLAKEYHWIVDVIAHEEEQIPLYSGIDQVDAITVMLIELKPESEYERNVSSTDKINEDVQNQKAQKVVYQQQSPAMPYAPQPSRSQLKRPIPKKVSRWQ